MPLEYDNGTATGVARPLTVDHYFVDERSLAASAVHSTHSTVTISKMFFDHNRHLLGVRRRAQWPQPLVLVVQSIVNQLKYDVSLDRL